MKTIAKNFLYIAALFLLLTNAACEQENLEPELAVAPGGGTLTGYSAYTISAATADDVYGRVVFWKSNTGGTLVQISLYNTAEGVDYTTGIFDGTVADGATTKLMDFYTISGATGEFSTHKFFVIENKDFYSSLTDLDGHVKILSGADVIASGDVGLNATPVEKK